MSLLRRLAIRRLQIGYLVLLAVCSAQLTWWLVDQVRYTAQVRSTLRADHKRDAVAARLLLARGARAPDVARVYPDLAIGADGSVSVAPALVARLDRQRFHRLNRYAWEGAFFLVVLLGAMAIVYHTLREEGELRRRQEDFVAAVSHELKSPVASLKLSAETLALRDPPSARRAELVERQLADLGRLERMIANILDASRLGHTTARAQPGLVPIGEAVAVVIEELRAQAVEHDVTLTTVIQPGLAIRGDAEGTRTILRNLLHNAIRAAPGGRVAVNAVRQNGSVRLAVRDSGVGFTAHQGARLFDKFYRLGGGRTAGTGLGLFLVRRSAELDGASVRAESPGAGRGATFTVTWPGGSAEA